MVSRLMKKDVPTRVGDLKQSEAFPRIWTSCDVRDGKTLRTLFSEAKAVINLAAEHRDDVRPVSRYHETNVEGASEVCLAARDTGISKIIFASSAAVYGFHPLPVDEGGPFLPFNPYGETKLKAEGIYQTWAHEDPSRTLVIIRPTVVFGEGNRGNVYNLLHQVATGKFMMVGPGTNRKSMAYVGNLVDFLIHTLSLDPGIHIFDYVDGPDMNMNTLVDHVAGCLGKSKGKYLRIPKPVALAGGYLLDGIARVTGRKFPISAVRVQKFCENTQFRADRLAQSGFKAPCSLSEGLLRTIEFEFPRK